jgi:hypothetical protein
MARCQRSKLQSDLHSNLRSDPRPDGGLRRAVAVLAAILAVGVLGATGPALAQDAAASAATAQAAADAARKAAAQAQQELEAARKALQEAEARAAQKAREAEEAEAAAAEPAAGDDVQDAREQAERAERRAAEAERKADEALAELKELKDRFAYDRTGLYLGAGAFWAPENFDDDGDLKVDNSRGGMAHVGYRLHRYIAIDARFDYLDDFDLETSTATGSVDGYAMTGNIRFFFLTKRFQPWVGIGGGAIVTDVKGRDLSGMPVNTDGTETDPLLRFGGGIDFYLTPHLVLTLESAYNSVGGDRDSISYGQLGAGLDFRF